MGSNSSVVITATVTSTTEERSAGANNTYTDTVTISRVDAGQLEQMEIIWNIWTTDCSKFCIFQSSSASQPSRPSATSYNVTT